ncbi:MAG: hypothetical protein ACK5RO_03065 [Pseudobdellovibrionaceae bacterium]
MKKEDFQKDTSPELDQKIFKIIKPQIEKNRELSLTRRRRWFFAWSGLSLAGLMAIFLFRKTESEPQFSGSLMSDELAQNDQDLLMEEDLEIAELQEDWEFIEMIDELQKEET